MCLKNYQPVNEYSNPCGSCPEYLNSCMSVVNEGFLVECNLYYCEWCSCYEECMNGGMVMKLLNYDVKIFNYAKK